MADPNRELFESVVKLLRPILDELVFVGGCTTGLLHAGILASIIWTIAVSDQFANLDSRRYSGPVTGARAGGWSRHTIAAAPAVPGSDP